MKLAKAENSKNRLKDVIDSIRDNRIFKLGFSRGSAFLFIGTKKEYDYLKDSLDRKCKSAAKAQATQSNEKIQRQCEKMRKAIIECEKIRKLITTANDDRIIADRLENIDLDDLEVLDVSKSDDPTEAPSTIINAEGFAKGKYCYVSAADRDREKLRKKMEEAGTDGSATNE